MNTIKNAPAFTRNRGANQNATQHYSNTNPAEISAALQYISPDLDRHDWIVVGMAIQSELGDGGFDLFDSWSAGGQTYEPRAAKSAWRSFQPGGGITVASLFKMAREGGYRPPKRQSTSAEDKRRFSEYARQSKWKAAFDFLPIEVRIADIAAEMVADGKTLGPADLERLKLAAARISNAKRSLCGGR